MRKIILLTFIFLINIHIFGAQKESLEKIFARLKKLNRKIRVGLVLSGGGAKGITHIGVLKVLEKAKIKIDYIAGTSMGSIVGGLYSTGISSQTLEKVVVSTDWEKLLSDSIDRKNLSMNEKNYEKRYLLNFRFKNWKLLLPKGLIAGHRLATRLSTLTSLAHHIRDFKKLPIPFLCIATDIENGKAVVLKKGFLARALRASMAIPTVFTPVEIDGKLLIDGGVVENFPVKRIRDKVDVIISVDVGTIIYKKKELDSITKVFGQLVNFLGQKTNVEARSLSDILILPDMKNYGLYSFSKAQELVKAGEEAALKVLPLLKKISAFQRSQNIPFKSALNPKLHKILISSIETRGLNKIPKRTVIKRLGIMSGDKLNYLEIEEKIERIYSSQFFESIN